MVKNRLRILENKMTRETRASSALASLGLVLEVKHKLQLDKKSKPELDEMKNANYNSLYARLCRTLNIPYSQRYLAKAEAIQGCIDWHNMLEDRRKMFGRTNCLEIALTNEQLEKTYGIKPVLV